MGAVAAVAAVAAAAAAAVDVEEQKECDLVLISPALMKGNVPKVACTCTGREGDNEAVDSGGCY